MQSFFQVASFLVELFVPCYGGGLMNPERHAALKHVLVPEATQASVQEFVLLDAEKLSHLRRVLRMDWDAPVAVADGQGRLFKGVLEKRGEKGGVRLEALLRAQPRPKKAFWLFLALPKNATMDWIVEKAVECGVAEIVPVISSRSVVRPHANDGEKYVRRWQAIMDGAMEQSERLWRPCVHAPRPWSEKILPDERKSSFAFISETRAENGDEESMGRCLQRLRQSEGRDLRLFIGPEGGVTDQERSELVSAGFEELSLGSAVLRVETAVIAALTLAAAALPAKRG